MITLTVDCSYHQKDDEPRQVQITLENIDANTARKLRRHLESQGWVVQFNGNNMDTYCSKKCAE